MTNALPEVQQMPATLAAPDPVQAFEKLVKQCQAIFEKQFTPAIAVSYNPTISSWVFYSLVERPFSAIPLAALGRKYA